MNKKDIKILLAEDDPNLGFVVQDSLKSQGYQVTLCEDGISGLKEFNNEHHHLCILDIMMPKKDGYALAEDIRSINSDVPIIFLTAKSLKDDVIKGFKTGADDYVIKPFSMEELSLRIEAILRRSGNTDSDSNTASIFEIGLYTLEYKNLYLAGPSAERSLTRREADVLRLLCINQNELLTREMVLNIVWGNDDYFSGRSLDVFISRLRKYLSDDAKLKIINVHGEGFRLEVKK